jgi:hypothetical protein
MNAHEHALELIHAEIDGELTGPQKAELSRLLLADPALHARRDQLREACAAIGSLPFEDPPAGLRASVMESLPASSPARLRSAGRFGRPVLRYAAAFAGGLIVSALAFQFALRNEVLDSNELVGTLAGVKADVSRLELHLDEVSGTVRVEGTDTAPLVVAELAASRPVQVIARLDGQEVRLGDFAATHHDARPSSAAFPHRNEAGPARVEIVILDLASGTVLQTTTLRPTVAN